MSISIRSFEKSDIPQLLGLMKELAVFEGYNEEFTVTEQDLEERGLGETPQFHALVAEKQDNTELLGMAVLYFIPYTISLKPTAVLKEFFVKEKFRSIGVGETIFEAAKQFSLKKGCAQMVWTVMNGNHRAENFYKRHDGQADTKWQNWVYKL